MALEKLFLLPLFLHVLLIACVGLLSLRSRISSVVKGETKITAIALGSDNWPENVRKFGNNFDNQFEVPTLWYAVCALLMITGKVDLIQVGLCWGFLIARLLHSYIHTGSNNVPLRMRMFLASFALVFLMWVWFAIRLFIVG